MRVQSNQRRLKSSQFKYSDDLSATKPKVHPRVLNYPNRRNESRSLIMSICHPSDTSSSTFTTHSEPPTSNCVVLNDGDQIDLTRLTVEELNQLQCREEPAFAQKIGLTPKGSTIRTAVIRQAYETICATLDELSRRKVVGQTLSMGMDRRYTQFVLEQLASQSKMGIDGGVFELGFGSGIFLQAASQVGHRIGGLEVASQLFDDAKTRLPASYHGNLWLGDFCSIDFDDQYESYSLAYWNDVFEHIPVDEISDYLTKLYRLLKPGGKLITITPNWHMRPSDVTSTFLPSRTEAVGFHLKEYKLREVRQLLLESGFETVHTPQYISSTRYYFSNAFDLTFFKASLEPMLEFLPFKLAVQMCRRFGLSCTVATKGKPR